MCDFTSCSCFIAILGAIFGFLGLYQAPPNKEVPFNARSSEVGDTEAPFNSRTPEEDAKESLPERRIILVGMTGSGKSATGNTILGYESFSAKPVGESLTGHISLGIAERFRRKLVVIDTPGLFDTNKEKDNKAILREISKCYAVTSPGIHAIILTIPIGRITENIDETVDIFLSYFGDESISVMIIVFTFKIHLEVEDMAFETYVQSIPKESPLYTVLKRVNGRYLAFGYKGGKTDRDEEVKELLDMIDRNVETLPNNLFSNEMFLKIEQYLQAEEDEEAAKYYEEWKESQQSNRDRLRRSIVDDIIDFFDPYFEYFSKLYDKIHLFPKNYIV